MKKLLALALAILTVLGLSASVFAAPIYTEEEMLDYLVGYHTTKYSLSDILPLIGGTDPSVSLYNTIYSSWIDTCPKPNCGGTAYFYVENGSIKWKCTKCFASGTLTPPPAPSGAVHTAVCPTCGKSDKLRFLETGIVGGAQRDIYYCSRCQKLVFLAPGSGSSTPRSGSTPTQETITCKTPGCGRKAKFQFCYNSDDGKVIGRYRCDLGHYTDVILDTVNPWWHDMSIWDYYCYTITLTSAPGGTAEVYGGNYAKYGERKTVVFKPNAGYILTSVTVNGIPVNVINNQVTFTVQGNTVVTPTFAKSPYLKDYTITVKSSGSGVVNIAKNSKNQKSSTKVTADYLDTVVLSFLPDADAKIADIKIDGKSIGIVRSYTFTNISSDHVVEVTFSWKSPYADLEAKYEAAVEYVTVAGIMGPYKTANGKQYFCGRTGITVGDLVCALAEMTDVDSRLNSDNDRMNWMINYGIVSKKTDFSANCDVQQACTIVKNYLEVLEDLNNVTFTKLIRTGTVKQNAISLNLATEKTFDTNRNLHRYDLASICRLIARLDYKSK